MQRLKSLSTFRKVEVALNHTSCIYGGYVGNDTVKVTYTQTQEPWASGGYCNDEITTEKDDNGKLIEECTSYDCPD